MSPLPTRFGEAPFIITFTLLFTCEAVASEVSSEPAKKAYLKADAGAVLFDLPKYEDGWGVVGLAPVSGPFFSKSGNQVGVIGGLTGGLVTDYSPSFLDGFVFFEASGSYGRSKRDYSSTLGSDSAGNNIRFGLFNGSNGFNSSNAAPVTYRLNSDIEYSNFVFSTGIEAEKGAWKVRYQFGPQWIILNQTFELRGNLVATPSTFYNRDESLNTNYYGGQAGISLSRAVYEHLFLNLEADISLLKMETRYSGTDARTGGGGSSLALNLDKIAYSPHATVGIRYQIRSNVELGLNVNYNYLSKAPKIVHATGSTAFGNFVPASLTTQSASIWGATAGLNIFF